MDVMDDLVNHYNNNKQTSTKMIPLEASQKKNENIVWRNVYGIPQVKQLKSEFSVCES